MRVAPSRESVSRPPQGGLTIGPSELGARAPAVIALCAAARDGGETEGGISDRIGSRLDGVLDQGAKPRLRGKKKSPAREAIKKPAPCAEAGLFRKLRAD